ncbi:MAG: hypothetical protein CMJ69_02750, partial [Planctomycetaceae bacterium]|nr:hypothetical protein [Planctomycetaceae bacterium]
MSIVPIVREIFLRIAHRRDADMLPRITTLLLVAAALLLTPFAGSAEDKDGWISLFNGKNFDGWKIGDAKQGKW